MGKDVKGGLAALTSGGLFFGAYLAVKCDNYFYKEYLLPLMHRLDAELVHHLALKAAKYRLLHPDFDFRKYSREYVAPPVENTLRCKLWGYDIQSPVGLAAGFDKNAEAVDGLLQLGFSFIEVGSVTKLPQPGNPKPRMFRLAEDRGLINRYGCPSDGYIRVFERLFKRKQWLREHSNSQRDTPSSNDVLNSNFAIFHNPLFSSLRGTHQSGLVGANLTMNRESQTAISDLCEGLRLFLRAADFIVLNLSTPNTPGVRRLQERKTLTELLEQVAETRASLDEITSGRVPHKPLLLKIAPDLTDSEMADVAELSLDPRFGVDGLVVTNTTIKRPSATEAQSGSVEWSLGELRSANAKEAGGLSGEPLRDRATSCVSRMYELTGGRVPIVGVGGISNGRDAFEKIAHGASLVEVYTAIVYEGPGIARNINQELQEELKSRGFKNVQDAVGWYHRDKITRPSNNLNDITSIIPSRSRFWYLWPPAWFSNSSSISPKQSTLSESQAAAESK